MRVYKKIIVKLLLIELVVLLILVACSTEKNTFINRSYHSVNAKFNGLYNANEMIRLGLEDYRRNAKEDFTRILPVELFPAEEDIINFYPIVDTAIVKCQDVITKHSMPTTSKPSQKKSEHALWIDQNWFTIGYAKYIRKDFDSSLIVFQYIRKFYTDRPSTYLGELWEAKTYIQTDNLTEATRALQKLETRKSFIPEKSETRGKNKKGGNKTPQLPRNFDFELAKTKAMLALAKNENEIAVEELQKALKLAKKKNDIARISFIIGQLMQENNDPRARDFYTLSIRKNAPFEMSFHAKINRSVVSNLGPEQMIQELKKLAEEKRYLEFRDQVYYAMSQVELNRQDREMAKYYLTRSVFYSLNNDLQKGISYENLGDLSFEEKNYVFAQKYYDSAAQVMPPSREGFDLLKNKADNLLALVENIEIINYEDSVQMIAQMSDKDREKFVKDVIKKLQQEEKDRKKREEERAEQMRQLQQSYAEQNQKPGSKFYFSNAKAAREGVEDFKRIWGQRKNEDFWRLSNKPKLLAENISEADTLIDNQAEVKKGLSVDSLTVDDLIQNIPLNDSAMKQSNENLLAALYKSGIIYKEQLKENEMAIVQFKRVLDKNIEDKHNLPSAFQLYKMFENTDRADEYKDYIIKKYPDSDYANFLRDPDYFVKKKERDALNLKEYLKSVKDYEFGLYYPVILKADQVITKDKDNFFRKEYFLLKAMAMGQINRDKTSLLPVLQQAIDEFPGTDVAEKAKDLINLIKNGIPPFEEFKKLETDMFILNSKDFYVIIELKKNQDGKKSMNNVSLYNSNYFGRLRLSADLQMYDKQLDMILIKNFRSAKDAKDYIKDFKKSKRYVSELTGNEMMIVSKENFKVLLLEQKLAEYKKFFEFNYD